MLRSIRFLAIVLPLVLFGAVRPAMAQQPDLDGCKAPHIENLTGIQFPVKNEQGVEQTHMILTGTPQRPVRVDCDDMHLTADQMEVFDRHIVVATGNVLFENDTNRIAAERLQFDTKTRTGVFYQAAGSIGITQRVDKSFFGTQEPDARFEGEEIHKLGPDTYKIVHGAFTTCMQPTPRWEMVAGSVTLRVDHHAILTNTLL